jgi:hypothetical protein
MAAVPSPNAGPDLGAIDYRADPSATGPAPSQAVPVGPMADRSIQSYDLPSSTDYDHMGG